jgi:hypothetical protein
VAKGGNIEAQHITLTLQGRAQPCVQLHERAACAGRSHELSMVQSKQQHCDTTTQFDLRCPGMYASAGSSSS